MKPQRLWHPSKAWSCRSSPNYCSDKSSFFLFSLRHVLQQTLSLFGFTPKAQTLLVGKPFSLFVFDKGFEDFIEISSFIQSAILGRRFLLLLSLSFLLHLFFSFSFLGFCLIRLNFAAWLWATNLLERFQHLPNMFSAPSKSKQLLEKSVAFFPEHFQRFPQPLGATTQQTYLFWLSALPLSRVSLALEPAFPQLFWYDVVFSSQRNKK